MSANITLSYNESGYVQAQFTQEFELTLAELFEVWAEVSALCKAHTCTRILCSGVRLRYKLSMTEAFNLGLKVVETGVGMSIAFCFAEYRITEVSRFFEVVTSNRGVRVRFFNDQASGLAWLMAKK